jgi:hypothetical protein
MKVKDSIGGLYKRPTSDGKEEWFLSESKITRIVQNSRGTKVYSKGFFPIEIEEIEDNTKLMQEAKGWINTREVVLLTPEIREKCNRWIKWANDNPDKAVGLISGA